MIKFFRKIRQNLLMKNKTGKYFKYAIGEIVLVVIGILIALGINNWNENRKNKNEEKIFLSKIHEDLTKDALQFDYYVKQFKEIDRLHLELNHLSEGKVSIDSISEPLLIRRTLYFRQLIESDFKENIGEISNQKIDEDLTKYTSSIKDMEDIYQIQLIPLMNTRLKLLLNEREVYNPENWFSLENRNFNKDYAFKAVNGKNLIDKYKFAELVKTKKFQQLLFELNAKWNEFNTRLEIVIDENKKLRTLISSELKYY